ncbi:hypothetical protein [Bradyrhizobium sp. AUGA SZCCT0283]|uniref:hypothetical protein n=1 Tax=Bradyrhizobium sp. AUGA SZCCT0283 TaxID=2807671 RepID=UPI001BAA9A9E|nr:hypothetical protein [Bradyrhizobium sp. AUGA SZCCT0283]MBR1279976.1 hypothetical protein [Bradyrhizobium sp. AUGA SZCCT0283]
MVIANPHVLLEMPDEPDCRFVAAWLTKVAEAQSLWSQALNEHRFADHVQLLHADGIPDLTAAALEIFGELEHRCHVAALSLYSDENGLLAREFGLLAQLGLFVVKGQSYWMAIPEEVILRAVKRAAFNVLSTAEDWGDGVEVVQPERLHTFSVMEAEAWRLRLIMIRRFGASTERHRSVQ